MGLAVVEMIMAIEDEFGIELEEDEVQPIETIWEMHELVCRKLSVTPRRSDGDPQPAGELAAGDRDRGDRSPLPRHP